VAVLQLLEREELQKLQKKWWYDKGECVVESDKVGDIQTLRSVISRRRRRRLQIYRALVRN